MKKSTLSFLLKTSRPRFWLYLVGTYLVGYSFGATSFTDPLFWIFLGFFLLPANFYLYGINDYHDFDTDQYNPKKKMQENLLANKQRNLVGTLNIVCLLVGVTLIIAVKEISLSILLGIFLFLATAYSAPPFRFKARPFFDFASNALYIIPGIFGYTLATNSLPPVQAILAATLWAWGMHLYSAIPDIISDTKAKVITTAVKIGKNASLILVLLFWLLASVLAYEMLGVFALISVVYPAIIVRAYFADDKTIERMYWWFPYINGSVGFLLFLLSVLQ